MLNKTRICCCRHVLPLCRMCVTQCQPVLCLFIPAPCSSDASLKQCLGSGIRGLWNDSHVSGRIKETRAALHPDMRPPHRTVRSCNALYVGQLYNVLLLNNNTRCGDCSSVLILLISGRIGEISAALQVGMPPKQNIERLSCAMHYTKVSNELS
jgi:hypothetical protein